MKKTFLNYKKNYYILALIFFITKITLAPPVTHLTSAARLLLQAAKNNTANSWRRVILAARPHEDPDDNIEKLDLFIKDHAPRVNRILAANNVNNTRQRTDLRTSIEFADWKDKLSMAKPQMVLTRTCLESITLPAPTCYARVSGPDLLVCEDLFQNLPKAVRDFLITRSLYQISCPYSIWTNLTSVKLDLGSELIFPIKEKLKFVHACELDADIQAAALGDNILSGGISVLAEAVDAHAYDGHIANPKLPSPLKRFVQLAEFKKANSIK